MGTPTIKLILAIGLLVGVAGCSPVIEIRVENQSALDFDEVRIGDQSYGPVEAGATSGYRCVATTARYVATALTVQGKQVSGQTLNFGSRRYTHQINVLDLDAGHLAIEVVRD